MKEEMILKCTEKPLVWADDPDGTEWIRLYEFRFPWNDYHFSNTRFFVIRHRLMDWDDECWDLFFNDLRSAMKAFGKEVVRNVRYGDGHTERKYKKPEYCDDWSYYRDELRPPRDKYGDIITTSSTSGDYGPSNPWDAPGMKISDFI